MDDERFVTDLLSDFGILPRRLVVSLLNKDHPETADKIIRKLRNSNRIVLVKEIYIAANRYCKPDPRKTTALWVVTKFLNSEGITAGLYPCRLPSVVTFIRNYEPYEVIVLNDDEDYLLAAADVDNNTKYIIVVPSPDSAEKLKHLKKFNSARYILATVKYSSMDEEPEINFYKKEE